MTRTQPAFELQIDRVFDAPRERVFAAWSTPEAMQKWFAPKPFQLVVHEMDFRVGGRFRMAMRGPDGSDFPFSGTYREIVVPERIVWTGEFEGGPAEQQTTEVRFEAEGNRTRLHARQAFHVMTPMIEQATKGAWQGWTMTLNQLGGEVGDTTRTEQRVLLEAPIERVWRAITDHREFGSWFKVAIDQPFTVGGTSTGHMTEPGYETMPWNAVVKAMERPHRFVYEWHPYAKDPKFDYTGEPRTTVEFRLDETPNGTLLTVSETGFERLPAARRNEAFPAHAGGWLEQANRIRSYLEANAG